MAQALGDHYSEKHRQYVADLIAGGLTATTAAQQMCKHFNLEYKETVGRQYRRIFNTVKETPSEYTTAQKRKFNSKKKRFIISWAQQDTKVHPQLLENIKAYAEHIDAEPHFIAGRYKIVTSLEASKKQKKKDKNKFLWDESIQEYLCASRLDIHEHLTVLGTLKVPVTASTPLSGLNSITGLESCIVGHPRQHLKSLPVLTGYPNKLLLTTGAITYPNYTDSKAGFKGAFHHVYGFIVVEVDGDTFHVRQVQADEDGNFFDLWHCVRDGKVYEYSTVPAIVFGDLHLGQENKEAVNLAFSIADRLQPEHIILHDIFDGFSVSHHEDKDPFILLQREEDGTWNLESEIQYMIDWFNDRTEWMFVNVMANHLDFLDRHLRNTDWRKARNKKMYLQLANAIVEGKAPNGLVPYLLDTHTGNTKNLGYDDSFRIGEWELGLHYDKGASGSRGSVVQFKNLNTKSIGGHGHSPQREDGSLMAGTLTNLKLGYNKGLSSWVQGIVIIYPNMKASHIHFIKNRYTTLSIK